MSVGCFLNTDFKNKKNELLKRNPPHAKNIVINSSFASYV
jgi:hypothetical protein